MKEIVVYHNPRCSKSRLAIEFLNKEKKEFEIKEYLKEPLTFSELKDTLKKLNISPVDLLRKQEAEFKENYKGKDLTDDQWIQAMIDFPKLMERPIVIYGSKAVIARPTERIKEII